MNNLLLKNLIIIPRSSKNNISDILKNLSPTIRDHVRNEYGDVERTYNNLMNELRSIRCRGLNHKRLNRLLEKAIGNQLILYYLYHNDSIFQKYYDKFYVKKEKDLIGLDDPCECLCVNWINELYNKENKILMLNNEI